MYTLCIVYVYITTIIGVNYIIVLKLCMHDELIEKFSNRCIRNTILKGSLEM